MQALLRQASRSQGETCACARTGTGSFQAQGFKEEGQQEVVRRGHLFSPS